MSDLVIVKNEQGKLEGLGDANRRSYERFQAKVRDLEIGETLRFSWKEPRSPRFHRLYFVMLHQLFDRQEQFENDHQLRSWLTVGAGYCDFVPGPTGRMVALPQSIAWDNMGDEEFRPLVIATWQFLRTEHAQRFLWPLADPAHAAEGVELLLMGFDA